MEQSFKEGAARDERGQWLGGDRNHPQAGGACPKPVVERDLIAEAKRGDVVQEQSALLVRRQVQRSGQRAEPHRRRSQAHHFRGDRREAAATAAHEKVMPGSLRSKPHGQKVVGRFGCHVESPHGRLLTRILVPWVVSRPPDPFHVSRCETNGVGDALLVVGGVAWRGCEGYDFRICLFALATAWTGLTSTG